MPTSLAEVVEQPVYEKWLHRRAVAHVRRDKRKRKNQTATTELYKQAIHKAVSESNGLDAYTKERLDWTLLSEWNNEDSMKGGRVYKRSSHCCLLSIMLEMVRVLRISEFALGERMILNMT